MVTVIGVLSLSWLILRALKALAGDFCAFILAPLGISRVNLKKYGSWAGRAMCSYTVILMILSTVSNNEKNCSCDWSFTGNRTRLCPGGKLVTLMILPTQLQCVRAIIQFAAGQTGSECGNYEPFRGEVTESGR